LVEQGTLNPKVEGSNPSRPIARAPAKRLFLDGSPRSREVIAGDLTAGDRSLQISA
jgi:hypothetical protein